MENRALLDYLRKVASPWQEAARSIAQDPVRALMPNPVEQVRQSAGQLHQALYGQPKPDYGRALVAALQGGASVGMALPPGAPKWRLDPETAGPLFHGGKARVTEIDPAMLQSRDHGFYGRGFYTARTKDAAKMYGRSISEFRIKPEAKVLQSDLQPQRADPALVREVVDWSRQRAERRAAERGKAADLDAEMKAIETEPNAWKNAVDRYAEANGYDVVIHSNGEVVVKNPSAVEYAGRKGR